MSDQPPEFVLITRGIVPKTGLTGQKLARIRRKVKLALEKAGYGGVESVRGFGVSLGDFAIKIHETPEGIILAEFMDKDVIPRKQKKARSSRSGSKKSSVIFSGTPYQMEVDDYSAEILQIFRDCEGFKEVEPNQRDKWLCFDIEVMRKRGLSPRQGFEESNTVIASKVKSRVVEFGLITLTGQPLIGVKI